MASKKDILKIKDQYFAVCPHTFEDLLEAELKTIGAKITEIKTGGILFESTPEKAIELILRTRIASKVLKQMYSFDIKGEKDIYFYAKEIKWKAIFNLDQTFKIDVGLGHSPDGFKRSKFKNTMYLGQVLKDAIVDNFRENFDGKRPDIDKVLPEVGVHVRIEPHDNKFSTKENVIISLDMCGEILSNRTYRVRAVEAPIRENLAAGLILRSELTEKKDFYDPMCGSGTFLVEALLIKGNITPSFLKIKDYLESNKEIPEWSFFNHEYFKKNKYLIENTDKLIEQIHKDNEKGIEKLRKNNTKVYGTDHDMNAIKASKINIASADLLDFVYLEKADGTNFSPGPFTGVVMVNPPYGERLGEEEELQELYYELGENFKEKFKGSRAYLITSNIKLLKKIGLKTSFRKELHNGKLEARFVKYELY